MKKIIFVVLCFTFVAAVFTSCGSKSKTDTSATEAPVVKGEAPDKRYVKLAIEINKDMPKVYPGGVRLDKVEAVSKKEFKYHYTFTQDQVVSPEEFRRSAKLPLSLAIQESNEDIFNMFRKDKMTLIYAYYKMDGSLFAEVRLEPEDYIKK